MKIQEAIKFLDNTAIPNYNAKECAQLMMNALFSIIHLKIGVHCISPVVTVEQLEYRHQLFKNLV